MNGGGSSRQSSATAGSVVWTVWHLCAGGFLGMDPGCMVGRKLAVTRTTESGGPAEDTARGRLTRGEWVPSRRERGPLWG